MEILGYFFFQLIGRFVDQKFFELSEAVYGNLAGILGSAAVAMFTLYFMLTGWRVVSGESHESMTSVVMRLTKMLILLSILYTSMVTNTYLQNSILDIRTVIVGAFESSGSGDGKDVYKKIDDNLDKMAMGMSLVNGVSAGGDVGLAEAKGRALTLGLMGQATPPIVAGMLVLLNELGMRIAIMLGPIFITAFMFKRTEDMFYSWVKFMVGSMLSLGVLSMVIGIVFELTAKFAATIVAIKVAAGVGIGFGITAASTAITEVNESVMTAGFGAVMTMMLLAVPVILNKFFGSDVGSYSYNTFSGKNQHSANPAGTPSQSSGAQYPGGMGGGGASHTTAPIGNTSSVPVQSIANVNTSNAHSAAQASGSSTNAGGLTGSRGLAA